ncbi:MAG TPA: penicillin-binding transpeptidase domain-containing protein [Terracidiphilus sp.]|nr:penicillin-binding transpeptidase domain-containing protein [Terracidiphilus sp.]
MKLSCVLAFGLAWGLAGAGAASAAGVDTPQSTQTAARKTSHLTTTHRVVHHRYASHERHAAAAHSTAVHRSPTTHTVAHRAATAHRSAHHVVARTAVRRRATVRRVSYRYSRHRYYERFTTSSIASPDIFAGDVTAGEDPVVRQAAIDALDGLNGTVVVINPDNGRIVAMVNQKMALSPGVEPCSTIKLTVAFAALSEGIVTRDTMVQLPGFRMDMTEALAHSNNLYFEELGRELGFERVRHYATEFGLGELAGYHIAGEQLGEYPDAAIPASEGGVGRMCSFGQGVSLTPLQLGAFVAAIANGGTLYYLQHPTTPEEAAHFEPRIKRTLNIGRYIPDVEDGMAGAVEYGTARSLRTNFQQFPVFGKTGTCSNDGTRFGWFASFGDGPQGKLVTVFLLEGDRAVYGPRAADLTGQFYKNLWDHNYFVSKHAPGDQTASAETAPRSSAE